MKPIQRRRRYAQRAKYDFRDRHWGPPRKAFVDMVNNTLKNHAASIASNLEKKSALYNLMLMERSK